MLPTGCPSLPYEKRIAALARQAQMTIVPNRTTRRLSAADVEK
jgi:hypothetical protein